MFAQSVDCLGLDFDDNVVWLLEELLPHYNDPQKMNDSFDVKEVMSSFKKWREQTTTGGRHLGHYKKA